MDNQLNLSTLFTIIKKWQRPLLFFVLMATAAGALTTLVLPKEYFSSTTIVPTNPELNDRNFIYSNHLMELSPVYGMEEDLDRLLTTAKLEGNFNKLVDRFHLIDHYKISNHKKASENAANTLKKNCSIFKTENGAVRINIWDTDKEMAANLANYLANITDERMKLNNQEINNKYRISLENGLTEKYRQFDSLNSANPLPEIKEMQKKTLLTIIEQDTKAIQQLKASLDAQVPGILVLEKAFPAAVAGKPKLVYWLLLSFFSSTIFGIFLAILLERFRKK
jgi:capsular polysaccharide biosynthesis protein